MQNNEPRTLALVHEPLSEEMLDHLAGHYGVQYCGDAAAYLLKEVNACECTFTVHDRQPPTVSLFPDSRQSNQRKVLPVQRNIDLESPVLFSSSGTN